MSFGIDDIPEIIDEKNQHSMSEDEQLPSYKGKQVAELSSLDDGRDEVDIDVSEQLDATLGAKDGIVGRNEITALPGDQYPASSGAQEEPKPAGSKRKQSTDDGREAKRMRLSPQTTSGDNNSEPKNDQPSVARRRYGYQESTVSSLAK